MTGYIWILPSWIYNQLLATIWMLHPTPIPHRYTLFLLLPPRRRTIYEELYPLLIHTLLATPFSQSPLPCQTSFLLHPAHSYTPSLPNVILATPSPQLHPLLAKRHSCYTLVSTFSPLELAILSSLSHPSTG